MFQHVCVSAKSLDSRITLKLDEVTTHKCLLFEEKQLSRMSQWSVYGSVAHLLERPTGEPQAKPYPDVVAAPFLQVLMGLDEGDAFSLLLSHRQVR